MGSHYRGTKEDVRALNAFINLTRASESLMAMQGRRLAREGLTVSQWGVLEALFHLGPMSQKDLGKKLLKTGGDITMIVNNLQKQSLVYRKRDRKDRRCMEIHLTAKGRRLVEDVLPRHVADIVSDMNRLSARDLDELRRMCRTLGTETEDDE